MFRAGITFKKRKCRIDAYLSLFTNFEDSELVPCVFSKMSNTFFVLISLGMQGLKHIR